MANLTHDPIPPHLTHRARIRPSLPHGQRMVWGINFVRDAGWFPITGEQAKYLEKQPANEGNPHGEKLFDAVTTEEAAAIDLQERRSARSGGSALNPVGLDGVIPPEMADKSQAELLARVGDAEERAAAAERRAVDLANQFAELKAMLSGSPAPAAPVVTDPIPKDQAKPEEVVPAKPARPGSAQRKPKDASDAKPEADAAPAAESPASDA